MTGTVVDRGSNGEPDLTDGRYWIRNDGDPSAERMLTTACTVVTAGPAGEPDLTGYRYWVRTPGSPDGTPGDVRSAANAFEVGGRTHAVPAGAVVEVFNSDLGPLFFYRVEAGS